MAIRVQTEFIRGSSVRCIYYNYDDDKVLADATGVTITIKDPKGTIQVDTTAMTKTSTGIYEYYYDTTSSSIVGDYQMEVISTNSSKTSYYSGHFRLSAGINE